MKKHTERQLRHFRGVAQDSLTKFNKAILSDSDPTIVLVKSDWLSFIDNSSRFERYVDNVENVAGILGFGRELSTKLNTDQLVSRVAERFAEIDLAEHAIRELGIDKSSGKLIKLPEGSQSQCDFKFGNYFLESKYTKNISEKKLEQVVGDALGQIAKTSKSQGEGCVWIFTYTQPENGREFQDTVMKIKEKFNGCGFPFKLNVQVYSRGLYGDATLV